MKRNCFYYIVFISIAIFYCACIEDKQLVVKSDENSTIESRLSGSIDSINKVHFYGKTDDTSAFKYLNLLNFSNFNFSHYENPESKVLIGDSLSLTLYNIIQPQLVDLIAFSDRRDTIPYFTRILFTPGDSIKMNVENGKFRFYGDNSAHYNFFLDMDDPLRQNWADYKQDPYQYRNYLAKSYKSKDSILNNYIEQNPDVSEDFKNIVGSEIKFEYYYNLILPRNIKDTSRIGGYKNNRNDMAYVYATTDANSMEQFFDADRYYENIGIEDFKRPDLINNDYFKRSLILYIRHVFANHDYLEYSRKNFLEEKKFIQRNFDGEIETYAIGRLINDFYMKGFGHGGQDVQILRDLIIEYQEQFSKPSYASRMNEILEDLNSINFNLTEEMLNEKLLSINEDSITFREILQKYPNQIKVIDFWASWCSPCLSDFKRSKNFRNKIKKDENLSFLYFSIDDDINVWKKTITAYKSYIPEEQQYLIINRKVSNILKHMLIRENANKTYYTIPRYSILDRYNTIQSNNAPRPSDSLVFSRLIKEIKGKYK